MTRKGQITVPLEIRRALKLEVGDKLAISLDEGDPSQARIRSIRSVTDMTFGALADPSHRKDMRDLREAAIEDIAENAASEGWQSVTKRK